ncbi:MAG: M24 family metallopeptidase [Lacipirellulaceae bacterium]
MSLHAGRRQKLRQLVRREKADALLVTDFVNVTYLTGFTGDDSYLLLTLDGEVLVTDPRYTTQLGEECPGLALYVRDPGTRMLPATITAIQQAGIDSLAVEGEALSVNALQTLTKGLERVVLQATDGLVEALRVVKDRTEIDEVRAAGVMARRAFDVVRAGWTPDATERDVARELEYQARRFGARGLSFEAIVAAGPRSALPHARATDRRVGDEAFTLIDWGAYGRLYASDLTRMLHVGTPSKKFARVYSVVLEAQLEGIEAIRPGVKCEDVDGVARRRIESAGYGKRFGHGLGHGLGLQVHEAPRLARNQETVLRPGMVVTVEPGIYLPGWGGIRIEDDVLVTKTGYELLTDVPKRLEDCIL